MCDYERLVEGRFPLPSGRAVVSGPTDRSLKSLKSSEWTSGGFSPERWDETAFEGGFDGGVLTSTTSCHL